MDVSAKRVCDETALVVLHYLYVSEITADWKKHFQYERTLSKPELMLLNLGIWEVIFRKDRKVNGDRQELMLDQPDCLL